MKKGRFEKSDTHDLRVGIHEAKTHLSKLLLRVRAGEEVIITKAGKPYARLCPLPLAEERKPGLLKGQLGDAFFDPLPENELDAWEGS